MDSDFAIFQANWSRELGFSIESSALLEDLTRSVGIIYTFDPTRELDRSSEYHYLRNIFRGLGERMDIDSRHRLPHYLAVCITKFDDPLVHEAAQQLRVTAPHKDDPLMLPRVSEKDALRLFDKLCVTSGASKGDVPTPSMLRNYFYPQRIRYFVVSSIGFYVDQSRRAFDAHDHLNFRPAPEGDRYLIRGAIHPINVVEPITWLAEQLTGDIQSNR